MKLFKTILVFLAFNLLWCIMAFSQSGDDCKYLTVLTIFRTSTDINEKAKAFFPNIFKKKDKYIEFNLSDRIDFFGIGDFKEKLKSKNWGINDSLLNNAKAYYKQYYFESFRSDFLRGLKFPKVSKLYLTLSKPVGDYLVAELSTFDPEQSQKIKFGKGLLFLFKFDEHGLIVDILYAGSAYN